MQAILVVDDSAVARNQIGKILSQSTKFDVSYAIDGQDALDKIAAQAFDLVLADFIMPNLDGLELLAVVRERFPLVPVIIVTGEGSEELAVRALETGAASYVPKRLLKQELFETVVCVLAASGQQRSRARLRGCIKKTHYSFELDVGGDLIGPLVAELQEAVRLMELCDEPDTVRVGVALEEAVTNSIHHGNLDISSSLREEDHQAYLDLLRLRRGQPPYNERRVYLDATLSREEAVFVIRDEGQGFDPDIVPDPTKPGNLSRITGRGLLLMRTFMDEMVFNEIGNEVTMVKRRCPPVPDAEY